METKCWVFCYTDLGLWRVFNNTDVMNNLRSLQFLIVISIQLNGLWTWKTLCKPYLMEIEKGSRSFYIVTTLIDSILSNSSLNARPESLHCLHKGTEMSIKSVQFGIYVLPCCTLLMYLVPLPSDPIDPSFVTKATTLTIWGNYSSSLPYSPGYWMWLYHPAWHNKGLTSSEKLLWASRSSNHFSAKLTQYNLRPHKSGSATESGAKRR